MLSITKATFSTAVCMSAAAMLNATPAGAQITLNSTGVALGLHLSSFVTGLPTASGCNCGPEGLGATSDGYILVGHFLGQIYKFADVDGQTLSDALTINSQFSNTGSTPQIVNLNGQMYLARDRRLYTLNNDGSVNSLLLGGAQVTSGGLAANSVNSHIYANSNIDPGSNLTDINIATNSASLHPAPGGGVGSTSLDGAFVYVSGYPGVYKYSTSDYSINWISTTFTGPMATILEGPLAGDVLGYAPVSGDLQLINQYTGVVTVLGTGGALPGVQDVQLSQDINQGDIMISIGSDIIRVSFGPATTTVDTPEPATFALLGGASALILAVRRRRGGSARAKK